MDEQSLLFKISTWVLPIVLAVTLHEASHGWVAWKLGDDTAFLRGRVTFNPLKHIDPFGTIILLRFYCSRPVGKCHLAMPSRCR